MTSMGFSESGDTYFENTPLKRPPYFFWYLTLSSIVLGVLTGGYGFISASSATNNEQFLLGSLGYLFTALFPIVLLQITRAKHLAALKQNSEIAYDIYGGAQLQSRMLKSVLLGLIVTALPIWVVFTPFAERFV